jgi:DNA/RNA-binding domain of Phe-tRNA-synthetase-like protein
VRFAAGDESFTAHDAPVPEQPEPGEVIFADPAGLVVARRWCWKQSTESTVQLDTRNAILTIEAQHPGGQKEIEAALKDLSILLERFVGGDFQAGILDKGQPGIR